MKVLVDYDNIPANISRQGLLYLADRILMKIFPVATATKAMDIRLYGGWDRMNQMTTKAQQLSAQLRSQFPRILKKDKIPIRLGMQLAESLEVLPAKRFANTLRADPVRKLHSLVPSDTTCRSSSCPLDVIAQFINTEKCPVQNCIAKPHMLLLQNQQKLVDTMMVADLIHLSATAEEPLAIVSSDDDMWPGILSALHSGANVIHLQTGTLNIQPAYLTTTTGVYTPLGL